MKNCHDEVAAKDHWVCDDNHGGETEVNEASDEFIEEGDDEEESEDPAWEENDPGLHFLGSESGSYGERKDGKRDDDWRYVRLQASYLGRQEKYKVSRRSNKAHLTQSGLKHDKHDSWPNEDAKDCNADLVGDVDQVEATMVDVGVPVDQDTDDVDRAFWEKDYYINTFKASAAKRSLWFLFHYFLQYCV